MAIEDPTTLSAAQLAAAYRTRQLSPVEVIDAVLDRIEAHDGAINAFITLTADAARVAARAAEEQLMREDPGSLGPLHGVPFSVKDLTPTAGVRTTFGAREYLDHVPMQDGLGPARIKAAGGIMLGKTATPPFGMLGVTYSDVNGMTNNPWGLDRTVAGSSGGAGAAIAAGFGPLATGSDGGGSIRVPASMCGVVGLKASHGRIPIYSEAGAFEVVDVVGPLTRTVEDAALMLSVMAGPHPRDPYSLAATDVDWVAQTHDADASVRGLRVGYATTLGQGPVEPDVARALERAARGFADELGAHVEPFEIDLPDTIEYFLNAYGPGAALALGGESDEAAADLRHLAPISRFVEWGQRMSAVAHHRTLQIEKERIFVAFADLFDRFDLLLTPTTPQTAWRHADATELGGPSSVAGQDIAEPSFDHFRFTEPPSHGGFPCITVPAGLGDEGMPVGLQIIGPFHDDAAVLRAAAAYEAAFPWSVPQL